MNRETLPPPSRRRLTRTDYHRMAEVGILAPDARVELIDGEIIDMAPIGPEHAGLVNYLNTHLNRLVGERAIVSVRNPFAISKHSEPEPDVLLLRPRADFYARAMPEPADVLLLIEVAASSLHHDRNVKGPLYARAGLTDYWVLDIEGRRMLRHRDPSNDGYASVEELELNGTLDLPGLPGRALDLSSAPL